MYQNEIVCYICINICPLNTFFRIKSGVIIRHNISARKYTVQSHNMGNETLINNWVKNSRE